MCSDNGRSQCQNTMSLWGEILHHICVCVEKTISTFFFKLSSLKSFARQSNLVTIPSKASVTLSALREERANTGYVYFMLNPEPGFAPTILFPPSFSYIGATVRGAHYPLIVCTGSRAFCRLCIHRDPAIVGFREVR